MAENIVSNLFGIDPAALQQQRTVMDSNQAYRFAQLDPLQQATMSIYQGSAGLGRGVNQLLGGDEQLNKATKVRQLASQFDLATPDGLEQFAKAVAPIAPDVTQVAIQRANQIRTNISQRQTAELTQEKTRLDIASSQRRIEQDEKLREALAALPPNATEAQYLAVFRQFGSPDQQARVIQASMDRNAKLAAAQAEAGTVGTAGAVGKTGAYRDINGTVYGPTEMKTIRNEFKGSQDLLDTLNQITPQDVKNSESFIDWTTKSNEVKSLATKKTLTAQSKIALSQLMQQIESLPPGSASDADMRAAMKNFPGYSDPDALASWINDTKAKLQRNLGRISDQFAFKQTITSSGNIDLKAKPAAGVSTSDNDLITKYLIPTAQQGK
jgi:hypothetical protein